MKSAGVQAYHSPDNESQRMSNFKKGDLVYVVGRSSNGGGTEEELRDTWVLLLQGGWIKLYTSAGVR